VTLGCAALALNSLPSPASAKLLAAADTGIDDDLK
jgi:hypothetical protein